MRCIDDPLELQAWRDGLGGQRVAMVPTMGYLHAGHVALLHAARMRVPSGTGVVVLTIFVNPTQFDDPKDLELYPRDLPGDLAHAESAGVDVVFTPQPERMYPSKSTWVEVDALSRGLCGAGRPGHFRGVCTVVTKLWQLVRPDVALFGQKDFQQLAILRRMHADLFLSGEIVGMPTVREPDGLAMSSRNARLPARARQDALAVPRFLEAVSQRFAAGVRARSSLLEGAERALSPGDVEYVELADAANLEPIETVAAPAVVAVAVRFGGVRLIDNVVLHP